MKLKYFFIGALSLFVFMLPYFILGEYAYITIHDFLEQDVAIIADLKNNGILTGISGIVPNMDGLERSLFQSFTPFDVKMVCSYLLPPYWAIVVYSYLLKLLTFVGMFLLVDTYIMNNQNRWITTGLSLSLAFVPFYVLHGISGVGFPMIIYAFLNLYYNKKIFISYLLLAIYSFNSWLAYGGFFVLVLLFIILCYDFYKNRLIRKHVVYGAAFMCLFYFVANWGTIYSMFFSTSFISHRTEWVYTTPLMHDLSDFVKYIIFSQYHAGSVFAAPIILLFFYLFLRFRKQYYMLYYVAVLYCLVIMGTFIGMLIKHLNIQLFIEIQFNRFNFLYPATCLILLATCCKVYLHKNSKIVPALLILYGIFSTLYFDTDFKQNVKQLFGQKTDQPCFKEFYDVNLFSMIQKDLNLKSDYKTRVVSIGLFPSIAEFNGFYTIDSYRVNYPVEFKHKFRRVISKELEKNEGLKDYFDKWGSRCYIFSSELGQSYMFSKYDNKSVEDLCIDTKALKELGCEYVISAVDIKNFKDLNLSYVNNYITDESYREIRVYKLN